jgi:hypothetical protein
MSQSVPPEDYSSAVSQRFINCHNKLKKDQKIRSSRQFALALDYLPQSLSEILKQRRDVTVELLCKAIERFQINPQYLFTGEGSMFSKPDEPTNTRTLTVVTNSDHDEQIVHVPIPAQAGYASEDCDVHFIQALPTYTLPDYKYKVGTHRSFDVSGDGMEPTLFEGDKVICSYLEPNNWENALKDNYMYALVLQGDLLIRRIKNNLKIDHTIVLLSDNNFYQPTIVELKDIREIWYVRARITPFLPSPKNINNLLRQEMSDLTGIIQQQSQLIQNLNQTIEALVKK